MKFTAGDIADRLTADIHGVCKYLLPQGEEKSGEWLAGSVHGDAGKSLKVSLSGPKKGRWCDFADEDQRGDLLDLWAACRGLDLGEAFREACDYLGVEMPRLSQERKPARIKAPQNSRAVSEQSQVMSWLRDRGFSQQTVKKLRLAERDGAVMFPAFSPAGQLQYVKYRSVTDKKFWSEAGGIPCLFGWQAMPANVRAVVACEGELDCAAWAEFGIPALSPTNGAGNASWIETEFDNLARFDTIFLSFDMDDAGQSAIAEIAERLGQERCRIVELPHKDANDCLRQGMTSEQMWELLAAAKTLDPQELVSAASFEDELIAYRNSGGTDAGIPLPFAFEGKDFLLRQGELIILAGVNGSGKALALDTPIATPRGWTTMGELDVGEQVFDETGKPCTVTYATKVQHNRKCYKITFSDHSTVVCDADHRWLTYTAKARQSARNARDNKRDTGRGLKQYGSDQSNKRTLPSVVTTEYISKSVFVKKGCWKGLKEHSIQVCEPLIMDKADVPIDPYVLGAWLGDGSSYKAEIHTDDPEILEYFADAGYEVKKWSADYSYGINGGLINSLRENKLLANKHVPRIYFRGSYEQRISVIQGMMDTDGYIDSHGQCEFTTTRRILADNIVELLHTMGIQCSVKESRAKIRGRDCGPKYRVGFKTCLPVFRLERKRIRIKDHVSNRSTQRFIVSCEPVDSVPVRCIQVDSDSHLYLCGDSLIPTHNTELANQLTLHAASIGQRACIGSFEFKAVKLMDRIQRQAGAMKDISDQYSRAISRWFDDRLWLFVPQGRASTDRLLDVFEYAVRRYNIRWFVIDNLAKCGIPEDDYNAQKRFAERLSEFARDTDSTVILCAHQRKGQDETRPSGKMDVKGTGALTDMADSVMVLWKNKEKARERERAETAEQFGAEPEFDESQDVDGLLIIEKQRNGETEPVFRLWYHFDSHQYIARHGYRPIRYVQWQQANQRVTA